MSLAIFLITVGILLLLGALALARAASKAPIIEEPRRDVKASLDAMGRDFDKVYRTNAGRKMDARR